MGEALLNGFILPENTQFPFVLGAESWRPGHLSQVCRRRSWHRLSEARPGFPGRGRVRTRASSVQRGESPGLRGGCHGADRCCGQVWVAAGADQHGSLAARKGRHGHPSFASVALGLRPLGCYGFGAA